MGRQQRQSHLITRVFGFLGVALAIALASQAVFHHASLRSEADELTPPGTLVEVDGNTMHLVIHGSDHSTAPTVVLLAGAATIAPSYEFAPLARELAATHRTVIVEKFGYGYSDIIDTDRPVTTLVDETRTALREAGILPPYVLAPHSMSGLEALSWVEQHPHEVAAVIGLDLSTPEGYEGQTDALLASVATAGRFGAWLGLQRIHGLYPGVEFEGLADDEARQLELLVNRNAGNVTHVRESEWVLRNAATVGPGATPTVPALLFSSDGRDHGDQWVPAQQELAERSGATLRVLDCGHRVHHCDPDTIVTESLAFLAALD